MRRDLPTRKTGRAPIVICSVIIPVPCMNHEISTLNPVHKLNDIVRTAACVFGRTVHDLIQTHCRGNIQSRPVPTSLHSVSFALESIEVTLLTEVAAA